ncbi:hypothetical protein LTR84_004904 [Exophiala bonariae]|uniref:RNA-dependent RNA polymerase n=1 Tax=Exophiala bonariae TaxID=1690606 RepID=A0AAV9NNJ5_9EURO|nr:hypothetical protein LTR84_004904 [Exophiala bonariae]
MARRHFTTQQSPLRPNIRHSHSGSGSAPSDDWRTRPSVRVYIPSLPEGTTTWEIYQCLAPYGGGQGKIDSIRINESRQGNFSAGATVIFKPPPRRAPWEQARRGGVQLIIKTKEFDPVTKLMKDVVTPHSISVIYDKIQPSVARIESPIRPGISYLPEMTLIGASIDFGYLINEQCMARVATESSPRKDSVRLVLNLKKREIALHFPVALESKGNISLRAYRFHVALDDQFSMCDTFDGNLTSLVIHVSNPPWYSKELKEAMQLSHIKQPRTWSSEDAWVRQTDIVDRREKFEMINDTPVSLHKDMNSINIARWTTFRFNVKPEETERGKRPLVLQNILNALMDFNVRVTGNAAFKVQDSPNKEAPMRNILQSLATIRPSQSIYLDFQVRYQLEVCISSGWLNEYLIDMSFLKRLSAMDSNRAKQMLIHVDALQTRVYNPMDVFEDIRFQKPVRARALPANCEELLHATVTATALILHTPSVEITNRIVRQYQKYSDRFLRVRFEDDSYRGQSRLFPATNNKMLLLFERVRRTMRQGIIVAGRHYEFLAWGNSQLREHGAYFFAAAEDITVETIRAQMGRFHEEKIVAKRAARMGQCFSTTKPVTTVGGRREWTKDPTPDVINNGYTFTDGVGKISRAAAELIQTELKLPAGEPPSAFQFRLGGCKGVLAIDTEFRDVNVLIRPSQFKFDSDSDILEIIRVSEYWQSFLNRQLILVLSDLGVPDAVFLQKQEECIAALDSALSEDEAALRSLRDNVDPNLMTTSIANLVEAQFRSRNEPFAMSLLMLYRACTLKYLKEKAKIPIAKGAFVLGIADETGTLRGYERDKLRTASTYEEKVNALPQIFIQYTNQHTGSPCIVEGICFVARNPSLHRGDIRVVNAVNVEKLRHLRDVVVMPTDGDRDLPSMCSGGDLDGDDYIVCWDKDLIPPVWDAEPFHYNAPDPVTKDQITTGDIINFFHDYLQNDFLGRIAHAHLAAADFLDAGIRSRQCIELVNLHSMAVDYPKTGVPAQMPRDLERDQWPHFMEKKGRREYRSRKILGRLYDAVERVNFVPKLTDTFDPRILHWKPKLELINIVKDMKKEYEESMRRIMAQHKIQSEFEVWSTFVLSHSKAARDFKFHEEIGQHSRTLKEAYYEIFCEEAGGREFQKLAPYAVAAYHVTYEEVKEALFRNEATDSSSGSEILSSSTSSTGSSASDSHATGSSDTLKQPSHVESASQEFLQMPMISFPWILQDVLCKLAMHTQLDENPAKLDTAGHSKYTSGVAELFVEGGLATREHEQAGFADGEKGENELQATAGKSGPGPSREHVAKITGEPSGHDLDGFCYQHFKDPASMTEAEVAAEVGIESLINSLDGSKY